ncbi:root hair specific 4 [Raphanus sativus]|nr:root hair specific 4 [Raphanus sativus]
MVLPPAMPPPRDSTVPLPMFPEPKRTRKKLSHQECILLLRNSLYSKKKIYKEEDFKCNAFCLSLPGLRKHKPATSSKRKDSMEKTKMITASSFTSVEKYEWSHSWTSTTSLTQDSGRSSRGGGKGGRYAQEPATSSFSFDIETEILAMRSVLKTRSSRSSSGRDRQRSAETTHSNAV